ncbi:hypothetical protein HD806DRAFT_523627 [Xylariaceae sp. AK1471]|nr:hypothetical protein HD806DRAFT_523627 [Xylariaceae sp. AK1471]
MDTDGSEAGALWNRAEVDVRRYPAFAAWKEGTSQLNRHLEDAVLCPGVSVLSLASQPATGKSTTLIQHICELAKMNKAPRKVRYVVSSGVEARFIESWFLAHGVMKPSTAWEAVNQVEVITTEALIKLFGDASSWPDQITIVFDINWYPTVDDEMALGLLLHHASKAKERVEEEKDVAIHIAIMLLMSGFVSTRTIEAFRSLLGRITEINLLHIHHDYSGQLRRYMGDGDWQGALHDNVQQIWREKGRVVLGDGRAWTWDGFEEDHKDLDQMPEAPDVGYSPEKIIDLELQTLKESKGVIVNGDLPFTVGLANVHLVACTGKIDICQTLEPRLMQLVQGCRRRMMWPEILRMVSWGIRSSEYGRRPICFDMIGMGQTMEEVEERAGPDLDDLGRAWNEDLPFLLLSIFRNWPCHIRRLRLLDCIAKPGASDTGYHCTSFGRLVLEVWKTAHKQLSFHVAFLLARVVLMRQGRRANHRVMQVLIYMAAIAHEGLDRLFEVQGPAKARALRSGVAPLVRDRFYAGGLWIALALFLRCRKTSQFQGEGFWRPFNGLAVDNSVVRQIWDTIEVFASVVGTRLFGNIAGVDWEATALDEAELSTVDQELMWAWLHRIVMFTEKPLSDASDAVVDCASFKRFSIDMGRELIDAEVVREESAGQNQGGGGFFAIYQHVLPEGDGVGDLGPEARFICRGVTWIPAPAFKEVPKKLGEEFLAAVNCIISR